MTRIIVLLAVAACLCLNCASLGGPPAASGDDDTREKREFGSTRECVPGQYLVILEKNAAIDLIRIAFKGCGMQSVDRIAGDLYLVKFGPDPGLEKLRSLAIKGIVSVEPNYVYRAHQGRVFNLPWGRVSRKNVG